MKAQKIAFQIVVVMAIAGILIGINAEARRIRTKINLPKKENVMPNAERIDTATASDSLPLSCLFFFGFDKPLSSEKESFFATNNSDREIVGLGLEIEYLTVDSLQLHRRSVDIECSLPAGETRKIDIPTWDKQHSFYFHQSAKPRRQATPFIVVFQVIYFDIKK